MDEQRLDDEEWTYKGFHGLLHTFFPVGENPLQPMREYYGDSFETTVFFVEDDYVHWYWNDDDMTRIRKSVVQDVHDDTAFLDDLVDEWERRVDAFERVYQDITVERLRKLSDEELLELYEEFYRAYVREYAIAIGFQDSFSMHAGRFLEPAFREVIDEDFNDKFTKLMAPVEESFINEELKRRMRLLQEIRSDAELRSVFEADDVETVLREDHGEFYEKLRRHAERYHWIQNNYAKTPYLDVGYFIAELQEDLEDDVDPEQRIADMEEEMERGKARLMDELDLSDELRDLVRTAEVFSYMQDERKKYVLISNHYQRLFMDEIGRRLDLSKDEMNYTVFPELEDMLLHGEVDREELRRRKGFCMCMQTLDGYEIRSGEAARSVYEDVFAVDRSDVEKIEGQVASTGTAEGHVKIVQTTHDMANMEQGDVLVTSMTRPEMMPAVERASAIVTDEGGVTCHAAIVSRELDIPCVIATGNASKALQDGDYVEVDAEEAVVRKIDR